MKAPNDNTRYIGFRCSQEFGRLLHHIARREGRSVSGQVRWFLEQTLDGEVIEQPTCEHAAEPNTLI